MPQALSCRARENAAVFLARALTVPIPVMTTRSIRIKCPDLYCDSTGSVKTSPALISGYTYQLCSIKFLIEVKITY
jgi:hypothetical protein